jgi:hypothetical protein
MQAIMHHDHATAVAVLTGGHLAGPLNDTDMPKSGTPSPSDHGGNHHHDSSDDQQRAKDRNKLTGRERCQELV